MFLFRVALAPLLIATGVKPTSSESDRVELPPANTIAFAFCSLFSKYESSIDTLLPAYTDSPLPEASFSVKLEDLMLTLVFVPVT